MTTATNIAGFAYTINVLCRLHSASVTSWIRTADRNRAVGGNPQSFHLSGLAVDVVLDNKAGDAAFIRDAKALGLDAVEEGDHIHVEADNAVTRLAR